MRNFAGQELATDGPAARIQAFPGKHEEAAAPDGRVFFFYHFTFL
jgi:hypothetical protein